MLSYADRAKSKPKVPYKADVQLSASTSVSSVSPTSTPPSSVATAPTSLTKGDISPNVEKTEHSSLGDAVTPATPSGDDAVTPQSTEIGKTEPADAPATSQVTSGTPASVSRPNVWQIRAQARATGLPVSKPASSANSGALQPADSIVKAPLLENGGRAASHQEDRPTVSRADGSRVIDEQAWPEVGPSTGSISRGTSRMRSAGDKDVVSSMQRKVDVEKSATNPTFARQQVTDKAAFSSGPSPARATNKSAISDSPQGLYQLNINRSQPGSTTHSLHASPARPQFQLPSSISHSPLQGARRTPDGSRPHSQFSSAQNSPRRRNAALGDAHTVSRPSVPIGVDDSAVARGRLQFEPTPHQDDLRGRLPRPSTSNLSPVTNTLNTDQMLGPGGVMPVYSQPPPSSIPMPLPDNQTDHYQYQYSYPSYAQTFPHPYPYPFPPYTTQPTFSDHQTDAVPQRHTSAHPQLNGSASHMHQHSLHPQTVSSSLLPRENQLSSPPLTIPATYRPPSHPNRISFMPASTTSPPIMPNAFSPPQVLSHDFRGRRPPTPQRSAAVTIVSSAEVQPVVAPKPKKIRFGSISNADSPATGAKSLEGKTLPTDLLQSSKPNDKPFVIGFAGPNGVIDLTVGSEYNAGEQGTTNPLIVDSANGAKFRFGSLEVNPSTTPPSRQSPLRGMADLNLSSPSALGLMPTPNLSVSQMIPLEQTDNSPSVQGSPRSNVGSANDIYTAPVSQEQYPPHQVNEISPSSSQDLEVRDYGYGFGAPFPGGVDPAMGNMAARYFGQPGPFGNGEPEREGEGMQAPGYYYPGQQSAQPARGAYPWTEREPWSEREHARSKSEEGYSGHRGDGWLGDRRGRGTGFRRGRGANGRGFGRGFRGGNRDRSRDAQYAQEGGASASYRQPASAFQGYPTMEYPYYGMPAPVYINPQTHQALPLPITTPSFPLDPMRLYLLGQVEYYFSTQNLASDTHLRRQMNADGWIAISVIASFNRIRALTGGATLDHAVALVKDVLSLSTMVDVDIVQDQVRLADGKWRDFLLPDSGLRREGDDIVGDRDTIGSQDDTDDDIVFVMKDASPARRSWAVTSGELS